MPRVTQGSTFFTAFCNDSPPGSFPSVSTVNDITSGRSNERAASTIPDCFVTIVDCGGSDDICISKCKMNLTLTGKKTLTGTHSLFIFFTGFAIAARIV